MNCTYKVGERRDIRAVNKVNVAYRLKYLRKKCASLNKSTAIHTEVYLAEPTATYITYRSRHASFPRCGARYPLGKGRRFCIIGAGVIMRVDNYRTRSEWVEGSVKVWAADKAASSATDDYHGNFTSEKF
ncbi:hypothetical protein PHYSODRAFT_333808 [Phytophthora sojae]|uniref:Uncharacterized protein n=1 Tax=Phytophthora sojae (strain P6497) TaxID=1094619 RepID=G4ZL57_PHYSP|nr:hypothetical protein PHYSODRAFT_333808 [Phytophthora sojae]EGZ15571.1 hypothetical protein PHYSODRAFT_333808 [Phytophthora sojae]|eukprot:XP_009529320.1 hypothetical protein PHYSODRAFT_333808 [Phytophthora sojae]